MLQGNIDASGDIITYDTVGKGVKKVVYFNQTEEPWKGMSYGSSTIGASGCGPTSMAIIISTLTGQTVTPQMTCAYSIANGEYVPGMERLIHFRRMLPITGDLLVKESERTV